MFESVEFSSYGSGWKRNVIRWSSIKWCSLSSANIWTTKPISAPVAIIFSLEGVFASVFGWIILSQFLNEIKITGIVLILFAVIFSQLAPLYDKKKYGRV